MTDTAPSFLRVQAAKAKARAHLAISQAKQKGTWEPTPDDDQPLHQAPSQTPNNQPTSPRAPAQKPPEKPQVPRTQAKTSSVPAKGKSQQHASKGKSARALAPEERLFHTYNDGQVAQMLEALDPLAVVDVFRTHAPNSAVFELAAPHLPTVMAAILAGAQIRGAQGNADRMTLFRMLGAPWTPTATASSGGGGRGGDVEALTDRFVRAVARVEQRLARRGLVAAAPPDIDGTAVEAEVEA